MRCLALAQRLGARVVASFVYFRDPPELNLAALEKRLLQKRKEIAIHKRSKVGRSEGREDVSEQSTCEGLCGAAWIVVDGYHFGQSTGNRIKTASLLLLLLDDCSHSEYYCADYILNQNLAIDSRHLRPRREPTTAPSALGPRYALLLEKSFCHGEA